MPSLTPSLRLDSILASAALLTLGLSGMLQRSSALGESLAEAAMLVLIALGAVGFFTVQLPALVKGAGLAFAVLAMVAVIPALHQPSQFIIRGLLALVFPVFAALGVAVAARPNSDGSELGRNLIIGTIASVAVINVTIGLRQALFAMTDDEFTAAAQGYSTYLVGDHVRLMAALPTNQDFALFCGCLAPALLVLGTSRLPARRIFLALSALVYVVAVLSLVRVSLIAGGIAGVSVFLLWGRGSLTRRIVATTCTVAAAVGVGAFLANQFSGIERVDAAAERVQSLFNLSEDVSFNARQEHTLPRALEAFDSNLWGWGVGSAGPVSQTLSDVAPLGSLITDNGYLLIGIQTGVLGLLAFVAMLLTAAVWFCRAQAPFARTAGTALIALLTSMFLGGFWCLHAPMAIVSALVGLGIASQARVVAGSNNIRGPQRPSGADVSGRPHTPDQETKVGPHVRL